MGHATLEDVARLAGVVHEDGVARHHNESNVAVVTSERVQKAISDLNYVPNSAARSLSRGRAMAIGLVVGWSLNSAFSSMLIDSMLQDTVHRGYSLVLFPSSNTTAGRVTKAFLAKQIDGVIMDSLAADDASLVRQLQSSNRPYVIIHPNRLDGYGQASLVRIDNYEGSKRATEHLIELGHRGIGFVSFPAVVPANERQSGYRSALEEAGISFRPDWVYESMDLPVQIGFRGALELLTSHKEITAIFAATDEIAMGTLTAIWQLGLRIPEDISVVGFDDISLAAVITPPLTTIHQPIDEVSRHAVDIVIEMIENRDTESTDLVLPTRLIVRNSTQPPRRREP